MSLAPMRQAGRRDARSGHVSPGARIDGIAPVDADRNAITARVRGLRRALLARGSPADRAGGSARPDLRGTPRPGGDRIASEVRSRGARHALLALALLTASGCKGPLRPPDASAHGHLTDLLLRDGTALGLALGAIATVWLLLATFGLLPGRAPGAPADTTRSRWAVGLLAASAFLVVDGHLLLGDLRARGIIERARAAAAGDAVRIQVNAQRWSFLFRHPGADGQFNTDDDVVTVNALRVPAGRALELQLAASDVVHGLHIPALRVQTDAIPGRITKLFAVPVREGVFPFQCSQHCGAAHYRMRGELEVVDPARYDAWIAAESERAKHREDVDDPHRNWGWEWKRP